VQDNSRNSQHEGNSSSLGYPMVLISKKIFKGISDKSYLYYQGDSNGLKGYRRCYFIRVPHISKTFYNNNKEILNRLTDPSNPVKIKGLQKKLAKYMETSNMVRISLDNISASHQPGDDMRARTIKDDSGIDRHVASYVIRAYFMGLFSKEKSPHSLIHTREDNNNNIYTDAKRTLQGRIDIYD
jgi:hypothetical protein